MSVLHDKHSKAGRTVESSLSEPADNSHLTPQQRVQAAQKIAAARWQAKVEAMKRSRVTLS